MLSSDFFQESDVSIFCKSRTYIRFSYVQVQVGGYKSVVKTLTAAFLAAYDSASQVCWSFKFSFFLESPFGSNSCFGCFGLVASSLA
jgi:hypothetical protein